MRIWAGDGAIGAIFRAGASLFRAASNIEGRAVAKRGRREPSRQGASISPAGFNA
jgi:hypothetical protein